VLSALWQDISYGTRLFIRRPAFSAIVIVTLALGIGVNAAIFSVAHAFLWNPVPFHDLDHLVMLLEWSPQRSDYWNSVAPANYLDWKRQVTFLKEPAAFGWQNINLGTTEPERVQGFRVSSNFFAVLGAEPAQGRTFLAEEEQLGREHEVVLSNGLWQRRFGSSPHITGSLVQLNGQSYTVVGVMPGDFNFPLAADVWVPLAMDPAESNDRLKHELVVFGRLKPGASLPGARAEMEGLAKQLAEAYPLTNKGWGVRVMTIREFVNGSLTRQFTLLLMGAVGFVLLIVCVNVTNLQLVLSTSRSKEISIRMAIGAGRWRMVRQLVTESILLALAGGLLSLVFAQLAIRMLLAHTSADMVRYVAGWEHIRLDGPAFVFILALALTAGIISGVAPALSCRRAELNQDLRQGTRASSGRARRYVRNAFVIAQVALSLVLLAGAAIMTKSFWVLSHLHHNFDPGTLLTMRVNLDGPRYHDPLRIQQFYDQVSQNLQTLPRIKSVALATSVPFANNPRNTFFGAEGQPHAEDYFSAILQSASPSYFETLNVNLLQGRSFTDSDGTESVTVAVVSRNLARRFWPQENPIGKRLRLGRANEDGTWRTIVGVVEDVQYDWTDPGPEMAIYLPYRQLPLPASFIVLRSEGAPAGLYTPVRNRVAAIDAHTPLFQMNTLDQLIADSVLGLGYVAVFIGILGFIALVLAALGVYGIMAQTVNERMHEIGVRMALGAQPREISRLVLNHGAMLTAAGVVIGAGMSLALARLLSGILAGVTPTEATTLFSASLLLAGISLVACYFPARRASHVDPKAVLHE
jgi:putative ABC transport system permease protein